MATQVKTLLALLLALVVMPSAAKAFNGNDSPFSARQELRQRLVVLLDHHDQIKRSINSTRQELTSLAKQRQGSLAKAAELEAQAPLLEKRLQAVELQQEGMARLLKVQEANYHTRLRALYLYGSDASAALWATSQDFADALFRAQTLDRILARDRLRLEALNQRRADLAALKTDLTFRQNELIEVRAQQAELSQRLAKMGKNRKTLLAGLSSQEKKLEFSIAALTEAETRLARTFALPGAPPPAEPAPHKSTAPQKPATSVLRMRGSLSPPVEGRMVGRAGPGRRGVVLETRPGAPVRAPWAGTVVYAATLNGYGRVVVLDHGQRVHTVLAHLGTLSVEKGMECAPGQVVGAVDGAGRLYLEVRRGTRPVNPLTWLRLKP
jgi:septal ring factor EnvC (AmiA/AmiB activator)